MERSSQERLEYELEKVDELWEPAGARRGVAGGRQPAAHGPGVRSAEYAAGFEAEFLGSVRPRHHPSRRPTRTALSPAVVVTSGAQWPTSSGLIQGPC